MATYSIRAPNGRTYQIEGPQGASQEQVQAEVLRQFPDAAGASPMRGTSTAEVRPVSGEVAENMRRWRDVDPRQARTVYENARRAAVSRITDPTMRERALLRFDSDPRMQAARRIAGLVPVSTPRQERAAVGQAGRVEREAARRIADRQSRRENQGPASRNADNPFGGMVLAGVGNNDFEVAGRAGFRRSLFGIPERLAAAGQRWLPSALTGNNTDLSHEELLAAERAVTDAEMSRSTAGNVLGQIIGAGASGLGAGGLVTRGTTRLASAASPILSGVGNFLQRLTMLQRGQPVRNVARVSAAGAAGGAAQAAGEGSDISTGAAAGALAAPLVHGAIRGTIGAGRAIRAGFGRRSVDRTLRSIISDDPADIQRRMAEIRTATGAEPTIYESLSLGARQSFDDAVSRMPASARERLVEAVQQRATNMVGETASRARAIITPRAGRLTAEIANDLARSRGARRPNRAELDLARRAARSPLDMEDVADQEARNIMAPHDATEAYANVGELLPQHPVTRGGTVTMVADDPDVASMIQGAAGSLRIADRPVTVRDITSIMSNLSRTANRAQSHIERTTAERAIQHLEDILARDHPTVMPAVRQMRDAYAARMRMAEGVTEGAQTRLRENIDPSTDRASRAARNAYDTPEGTSGRTLGQASRLEQDISTSPGSALRALDDIATNPTTQTALARNIGAAEADDLAALARTQTQSARRLGKLASEQTGEEAGTEPVRLMQNLLMLSPTTLPATKAQGLIRLVRQFTRMPERAANGVVEMLLSQNPAQISRAIGMLSNTGQGGRRALRDIAIAVGNLSAGGEEAPASEPAAPSVANDLGEQESQGLPPEFEGAPQPVEAGNLPLDIQFRVQNADGSTSTVNTITIQTDRGFVLIPTVVNGQQMSDEDAEAHYRQTGESFGTFRSIEDAGAYGTALHNYHARALQEGSGANRPQVEGDSPYAELLQRIYDTENPELLDLISRVRNQESGGRQFGEDGQPLTSPAGAIGVMQVMPGTAPEAAQLAGLEFDENAYRNDPVYNEILGIAYLSEQLRHYGGDVDLALAAYNAGQRRANHFARGGGLPAETVDYIERITS